MIHDLAARPRAVPADERGEVGIERRRGRARRPVGPAVIASETSDDLLVDVDAEPRAVGDRHPPVVERAAVSSAGRSGSGSRRHRAPASARPRRAHRRPRARPGSAASRPSRSRRCRHAAPRTRRRRRPRPAISSTPPIPPQIDTSGWTRSNDRPPGTARRRRPTRGSRPRPAGSQLPCQRRVGGVVVGRQRLLEPAEPERVERGTETPALVERVRAVAIGHPGHRPGRRRPAAGSPRSRHRPGIARSAASSPGTRVVHRRGLLRPGCLGGAALDIATAGGIWPDTFAQAFAIQRRDGHATSSRSEVVERHRDAAERPAMQPGVAVRSAAATSGSRPTTAAVIVRQASTAPGTRYVSPQPTRPSASSSRTTTESR